MTRTQKLRLIVVLTLFSAIALPRSSNAQSVSGTWTGVESIVVYEMLPDGSFGYVYLGSDIPATMNIDFNPNFYSGNGENTNNGFGEITINGDSVLGEIELSQSGPQSLTGNLIGSNGYYPEGGGFSLSFQSILPNGYLDTSNDFASASMYLTPRLPGSSPVTSYITFRGQGVPEPSSLVLGAAATLMLLIFAWMRGFFPRVLLQWHQLRVATVRR
jgi:hypothetical protein